MPRIPLPTKPVIAALTGGLLILVFFAALGENRMLFVEEERPVAQASSDEKKMPPITAAAENEDEALERAELGYPPGVIASRSDEFVGAAAAVSSLEGEQLFEFHTKKIWPAASLTKLVTALTALTIFESDERIILSEEAIATEGDRTGFMAGEVLTVQDLVTAMLVVSSNDAAEALASHGDRVVFMQKMNSIAADIGMQNTIFDDPSGLSLQNRTTVEDIEALVRYIEKHNPEILAASTMKTAYVTDLLTGTTHTLHNINVFAGRSDFLGGKTGYLPAAGGNLVSVLRKDDAVYIVTVFGTADRFGETEKLLNTKI